MREWDDPESALVARKIAIGCECKDIQNLVNETHEYGCRYFMGNRAARRAIVRGQK